MEGWKRERERREREREREREAMSGDERGEGAPFLKIERHF